MIHPTKEQLRAARALLTLSQQQLAKRAKLSLSTIQRIERDGVGTMKGKNIEQLIDVFAGLGVEFIQADNKKGVGVRKTF